MALTNIEYGSLASSTVMNGNFQYLDNRISALAQDSTASTASINSNLATLNSSLNLLSQNTGDAISNIESSVTDIDNKFSSNGLYVDIYVNGNSWYKEYFSDSGKTTRVWIEQGGLVHTNSSVTFLKSMSNANYTLTLGRLADYYECEGVNSKTTSGFSVRSGKGWSYDCCFYVCGR